MPRSRLSAEFREVYGALVNAQMRVRSLVQQEVERIGTDLGMPTRSEVNSIGERLQALRREVRARGDDSLAGEVAALREEFAALKGHAKRAQRDTEVVEPRTCRGTAQGACDRRRAAPAKSKAAKKVPAAARTRLSKKRATKPAAPTKSARPATAKKTVRRATAEPVKTMPATPTSGARNFASRIARVRQCLARSVARTRASAGQARQIQISEDALSA